MGAKRGRNGLNKTFGIGSVPVRVSLQEVSPEKIEFNTLREVTDFLDIPYSSLSVYISKGKKIIRSKRDGKLYVIHKI